MNKRAQLNAMEYMIYIFFVIIVSVFIYLAAFQYLNEDIKTTQLETFLLSKKLVYSESCLAYRDDIKLNPGEIDLNKLNSQNLITCFSKPDFGYLVKISSFDGTLIKSASNLNVKQEVNLPICKNVPHYECTTRRDIVQYHNGEELSTGYIEVEVIKFV